MSSVWFCLMTFLIPSESLRDIEIDIISEGQPLDVVNGTMIDTPGDPDFALRMGEFGFTIGLTLLNATTNQVYGVTSGHNLCFDTPESLYRWKGGSTLKDERVSVPPYKFQSATDCGVFLYDTRTFRGSEFIETSGYNDKTLINVTGWKVYDYAPYNYTIEKHGAATGYTKGYISAIAQNRGIDAPEDCNVSDSTFKIVYEVNMRDGSPFAKRGDCGSLAYNAEDKVIIGFVVANINNNGKYQYTYVVPYRYWVQHCGIQTFPQYNPSANTTTLMPQPDENGLGWKDYLIIVLIIAIILISLGCGYRWYKQRRTINSFLVSDDETDGLMDNQ